MDPLLIHLFYSGSTNVSTCLAGLSRCCCCSARLFCRGFHGCWWPERAVRTSGTAAAAFVGFHSATLEVNAIAPHWWSDFLVQGFDSAPTSLGIDVQRCFDDPCVGCSGCDRWVRGVVHGGGAGFVSGGRGFAFNCLGGRPGWLADGSKSTTEKQMEIDPQGDDVV